ncbi:hypothetical protein N0824_00581 [Microcystis sp. 0824]|uniref:Uncharacterized protein n=1 Tax=Microcystis aeruginosa NIES-2549 TaxID=1641812 RepID=A0A0F6U5P5_MICAE|nr:hypothetical protein MYAER_3193 [Microcystis aeruginosa NIES-2549]AOC53945.1 hypothetical protein amyaer_3240 [Microcystis aeruginosa NIES-2481]GBF52732.1 hypothetical protein N0824_00581 [Microcystis sp. 0824]
MLITPAINMGSGKVGSEGEQSKKLIKIKTDRGISDRSLVILKLVGFEMFLGSQLNLINR